MTAFEAVIDDLRRVSPDAVFLGGDLADAGSSPVAVVDTFSSLSCALNWMRSPVANSRTVSL